MFEAERKNIKDILNKNERSEAWLYRIVKTKGFGLLTYARYTQIIKGTYTGGYAHAVIQASLQVLDEKCLKIA